MRNSLVAGAAGLLLTMGGAAYASNPNVPNWSPYAIMAYEPNGPAYVNPGHGDNYGIPPGSNPAEWTRGAQLSLTPATARISPAKTVIRKTPQTNRPDMTTRAKTAPFLRALATMDRAIDRLS
jgi:hypothetical protein